VRIAIDCRRVAEFGVGTYIRNLLRAFSRFDGGHQFVLIHAPGDESYFRALPDSFERILHAPDDAARAGDFTLPRLIGRLGVQLTHIPLHRVPLFVPQPYVVTVHDLSTVAYDDAAGVLHQLRLYRLRRGLARAARIIAVSGSTRQAIAGFLPEASPRVRLIYNAPDQTFTSRRGSTEVPETELRERNRILDRYQIHYPFLLYAGRINPRKNIPRLIEAFAVVRASLENTPGYAELRLLVIGDEIGSHPEVRRAAARARVENHVRFLGFVPLETLRVFHETARAFVFPSLYEGFGLPPLEAMACGTPVVAARVTSLPEVTGDAARLVDPENVFDIARGITDVLTDAELRRDLIARGFRQAAQFSWTRTAQAVLDVYREVGPERRSYGVAGYKSRSSSAAR
jgi:glycosyltransferase involved in cell wall biosynthesis